MNNKKIVMSLIALSLVFSINDASAKTKKENSKIKSNVEKQVKLMPNKVFDPENTVGLKRSENTLLRIKDLIKQQRYDEAEKMAENLLVWMEDSTEYHTDLFKALKNLETARSQADIEKELALKSAVIRDEVMFNYGLILMRKNKKKQAVEHFVNIVRSQPSTDLGLSSYELLQKMGFTYKIQLEE